MYSIGPSRSNTCSYAALKEHVFRAKHDGWLLPLYAIAFSFFVEHRSVPQLRECAGKSAVWHQVLLPCLSHQSLSCLKDLYLSLVEHGGNLMLPISAP